MNQTNPLQNAAFRKKIPRKSFILKIGTVLLFMMSLLTAVSAQTVTSGQLSGNISDQSGAVIPDATVTVTQVGTGEQRTATTSDDGNYTVPNLAVGTYEFGGAVLSELHVSRGAAFGDLDNDGQIDIVVEDLDASPMILKNEGSKSNHWITLELGAKIGNPLAIGARIKVTTGKVVQTEEIRSGGSYLSQNDLRVHFGLGKAAKVDEIEIRWNSGKVETIKNVAADKFYGVQEGEGIVPVEKIRPKMRK